MPKPKVLLTRRIPSSALATLENACDVDRNDGDQLSPQQLKARIADKEGIVCLLTALRFHALGTQHPREVWLAVDRRAAIPKLDVAQVRIVRMSGAALTSGIQEHEI